MHWFSVLPLFVVPAIHSLDVEIMELHFCLFGNRTTIGRINC
jgi:hypothetical protein